MSVIPGTNTYHSKPRGQIATMRIPSKELAKALKLPYKVKIIENGACVREGMDTVLDFVIENANVPDPTIPLRPSYRRTRQGEMVFYKWVPEQRPGE